MPTPKQVRHHYRELMKYRSRLQLALNRAHDAGVIVYTDYATESPCSTLYETEKRIKATTEAARAKAIHDEVMRDISDY